MSAGAVPEPFNANAKTSGSRRSFTSFRRPSNVVPSSLSIPSFSLHTGHHNHNRSTSVVMSPKLSVQVGEKDRPLVVVNASNNTGTPLSSSRSNSNSNLNGGGVGSGNGNGGTLSGSIRSLKSKFSIGSSFMTPRTTSGSLRSRFSFGGSFSSRKGSGAIVNSPTLNSPASGYGKEIIHEDGEVLNIGLTPLLSSSSGATTSPAVPLDSPGQKTKPQSNPNMSNLLSTPTPTYPSLGRGLPTSLMSSTSSSFAPQTPLAKSSTLPITTRSTLTTRDASPVPSLSSRAPSAIEPLDLRPRQVNFTEHSRISEHTEPDTSFNLGEPIQLKKRGSPKNTQATGAKVSFEDQSLCSSEAQVSRELNLSLGTLDDAADDSLMRLDIPPIPRSGSTLSLAKGLEEAGLDSSSVAAPLADSSEGEGEGDESHLAGLAAEGAGQEQEEKRDSVASKLPLEMAHVSPDLDVGDDLAVVWNPHHPNGDPRGTTMNPSPPSSPPMRKSLAWSTSTRKDLTIVVSSTPIKARNLMGNRVSRGGTVPRRVDNESPLPAFVSKPASISENDESSGTRRNGGKSRTSPRKAKDDANHYPRIVSSPAPSSSSSTSPRIRSSSTATKRPSPSSAKRPSPNSSGRPSLEATTNVGLGDGRLSSEHGDEPSPLGPFSFKNRVAMLSQELRRPATSLSRTPPAPETQGPTPTPPRSYSSLGVSTQLHRRRGVEELFHHHHKHEDSSGSLSNASRTLRPRRSQSVDLQRPLQSNELGFRTDTRGVGPTAGAMRSTSRLGGIPSADFLGPRTYRAFQAAGLLDKRPSPDSSSVALPGSGGMYRRPHTTPAASSSGGPPASRSTSTLGYRPESTRDVHPLNHHHHYHQHSSSSGEPYYRPHSAPSEPASALTSSSDRVPSEYPYSSSNGAGRRISPQFRMDSPVSSSRTLYSSTQGQPYTSHAHAHSNGNANVNTIQALRDRHELETDALLVALGEAKKSVREVSEENTLLRSINEELEAHVAELESRLSEYERQGDRRGFDYKPERKRSATPRRSPLPFLDRDSAPRPSSALKKRVFVDDPSPRVVASRKGNVKDKDDVRNRIEQLKARRQIASSVVVPRRESDNDDEYDDARSDDIDNGAELTMSREPSLPPTLTARNLASLNVTTNVKTKPRSSSQITTTTTNTMTTTANSNSTRMRVKTNNNTTSRHSQSSFTLPQISGVGTASMLMNEQSPIMNEILAAASSSADEWFDDRNAHHDDDREDPGPRELDRERLTASPPHVPSSPTDSTFNRTLSPPPSPGSSLNLRTEDEIHLNDLISVSLRDDLS